MRILIVEDERAAAESLKHILAEVIDTSDCDFVYTYDVAVEHLNDHAYDLVFCDLLLLPAGLKVENGQIVDSRNGHNSSSTAEVRSFSPTDWERYVLRRGGIDLIRRLRAGRGAQQTATNVPVVMLSYFDMLPGYAQIIRSVTAEGDCVFLPKFYKNPEHAADYSRDKKIAGAARAALQKIVTLDLPQAEYYAGELRMLIFERRCQTLERQMDRGPKARKQNLINKYLTLTYKFSLVVEFDPRGDPRLDADVSAPSEFYPLSVLYEDWFEFRDRILLNEAVHVEFWLRVHNVRRGRGELIKLPRLSEPQWGENGLRADTVASRLLHRALAGYLAHASEPPQGLVDHGWTIGPVDLQRNVAEDIHLHPSSFAPDAELDADRLAFQWDAAKGDVPLGTFLNAREGNCNISHHVGELRTSIGRDIAAHYRSVGDAPFRAEHVIVNPGWKGLPSGYFFNGDLELRLLGTVQSESDQPNAPTPRIEAGADSTIHRILLLAEEGEAEFECLDGAIVTADDLQMRLLQKFKDVIPVDSASDATNLARPGDVVLCAPIAGSGLSWWASDEARPVIVAMRAADAKVILVPSAEASNSTDPEVFQELAVRDVHCIFTRPYADAIPEAKVIDAVLCTGSRVKYISDQLDDPDRTKYWREASAAAVADFRGAYRILEEAKALGHVGSGSASIRTSEGAYLITSSRTSKGQALAEGDLAHVVGYSPSLNMLRWVGNRKPSSSTPWHSVLYQLLPHAQAIIHTHNKEVTYSPSLASFRTAAYTPYGTSLIGIELVNHLSRVPNADAEVAILSGHGEVAVGASLEDCARALIELQRACRDVPPPSGEDDRRAAEVRAVSPKFRDPAPPNDTPPAVLLLTATDVEYEAAIRLAGVRDSLTERRQGLKGQVYVDLGFEHCPVWLFNCRKGSVGLGASTVRTIQALMRLDPSPFAVIAAGIAFGLQPKDKSNKPKQQLGDVLLADQIRLYEVTRVGRDRTLSRGDRPSTSSYLLEWFRSCEVDWATDERESTRPRVHTGLMMSGEKLVDDPAFVKDLLQMEPEAIGGEMEAAGVYSAATGEHVHWTVVKAICDWGMGKGDKCQVAAAENAIDFIYHTLSQPAMRKILEDYMKRR